MAYIYEHVIKKPVTLYTDLKKLIIGGWGDSSVDKEFATHLNLVFQNLHKNRT